MSVVINTNLAATQASNNLAASNASLQRSLNRLSSGSKIVNPADDAGGLAVSMKLSAAARRSGATASNVANALSFLQTQDGALKVVGTILNRVGELATLYNDPTKSASDKGNYDVEFGHLQREIAAIDARETFNGIEVLNGGTIGDVKVTEDGSQAVSITTKGLFWSAELTLLNNATDLAHADASISNIRASTEYIATLRARNGAEQSRLNFAAELLTVNKANLEQASSRITDVDVADESTQLARWNILVQSGTAMLAQANQSTQNALRLIS